VLGNTELVQKIQFEMLKEVKRICEKYNIKYFLCCGTLLGCIRHKGPIPWDDDLDVGFLREDYDRFIKIAPNELSHDIFFQTWHTDCKYALPHCKLRWKKSKYLEYENNDAGCQNGISIDILIFDRIPKGKIRQLIYGHKLNMLMNIVKIKRNWKFLPDHNLSAIKMFLLKRYSKKGDDYYFISKYESLAKKYCDSRNRYISEAAGMDYFRFIDLRERYRKLVYKEYMGEMFAVPKEYDIILKNTYGDYMKLPNESERVGQPGVIGVFIYD
jgi:lipopolysaccharide cholinephosphotransferase